ncbi:MAG: Do family serine endopeptidase [Rhodoplanes sp.]|uniref:Do family serine endopeptidase n=1 Tax=Rhodoplanes sp. TaxID=1968906 RepID=UPI0018116447|nr:Do family serine endopeptidase [Rhodoplanes sp.]NVO13710.1 Do family serine endopeptidase [Rhodoplanes sp.]
MPSILRSGLGIAAAVLATLSIGAAAAQESRVPTSVGEIKLSYAPVVKRVTPSVVNVYAARIVENRHPLMDDPVFRRFFGGRPQEQVQRSLGSGVIVDPNGLVMTNNHVIENMDQVKVSLADKREFEAEIVLKDARSDLAVLRLKDVSEKFPAIALGDSDALAVGDLVLAIGNPFGVGQTVTHGIVSAVARTQVGITDYQFFIQTDAAINPGNSGGALVDLSGKLIGINTAIFSRSGGSQGIGFAIPVNMVRGVIASAQGGSSVVRRPWLGAKLQAVTAEISEAFGLKRPAGALVGTVVQKSPADRAGLRTGDLIIAIDGTEVDDPNAFDYRFAMKATGGQTQVGVLRSGREIRVSVPLETVPDGPRDERVIKARSPFLGAKVANLSPALADELRLDISLQGVAIIEVQENSTARSLGFRKGDVVLAINGEKIASSSDLERAAGQQNRLWRITILREGQSISVVFGG